MKTQQSLEKREHYPYLTDKEILEINTMYEDSSLFVKVSLLISKDIEKKRASKNYENDRLPFKNFSNMDLSNANFKNARLDFAIFYKTILTDAIVEVADFKNAKCLTNEQKKYLRENGAKNVPPDLTEEEYEKEVEIAFRTWYQRLWIFLKGTINRFRNKKTD